MSNDFSPKFAHYELRSRATLQLTVWIGVVDEFAVDWWAKNFSQYLIFPGNSENKIKETKKYWTGI